MKKTPQPFLRKPLGKIEKRNYLTMMKHLPFASF